jgi:hypothetical protein
MVRRLRRAALAAALLAAPLGLAAATPASADTYLPRLSTGGCISGFPVTIDGTPKCRVLTGVVTFRVPQYSVD